MSFRLIVITPAGQTSGEAEALRSMFARGLRTLHVRKPGFSKAQLRNYLRQIPAGYLSRVVIHSHYSLLREFRLKGIHLTEKARAKKLPAAFVPARHALSASFHSMQQVKRARRKYDYVFLSPVFDSISKKGYRSGFEPSDLLPFLKAHKNVIALGGIEVKTIALIKQMRFSGAAALGFIWESSDPVKSFLLLASKIK